MAKRRILWSKQIADGLQKGGLRGWAKASPPMERRKILAGVVKKDGYATTIRRLNALKNLSKDRETDKAAKADMKFLQEKYRNPHVRICPHCKMKSQIRSEFADRCPKCKRKFR